MSKKKMRDSVSLVETFQTYFPEEYEFFRDILINGYKDYNFFVGARDNYLNIYFMGQSIAKIEIPYRRKTKYTVAQYIMNGEIVDDEEGKNQKHYISNDWKTYREKFDDILENARKNAFGKRTESKKTVVVHREKMCQQNIINSTNMDSTSDWYYVDMEYIDAGSPCGRVDMVAIRKSKNERGKHEVALVELKVGANAYGCSIYKYKERKKIYDELKENLYISEHRKYKFGSGILSHIADFLRYLHDNRYKEQLRNELVAELKVHKLFGVLNDSNLFLADLDENDFEEKPTIYILSFTHEKAINELKRKMYKYLYSKSEDKNIDVSERALEIMLNQKQVDGFIEKKEEFWELIENHRKEELKCVQNICGNDYTFIFKFWDPDMHINQPWNCL